MTDLEKKAKDCIENHTHKLVDKPTKQDIYLREESIFISGYKLGATENTALLSKHILELQADKGRLTDRVNELEATNKKISDECHKLVDTLEKKQKVIAELEKENAILEKALRLYVDWADECGIAWDNFPDMTEKWYKKVEEKELGWIDGLIFMVKEEAKEQFLKEIKEND